MTSLRMLASGCCAIALMVAITAGAQAQSMQFFYAQTQNISVRSTGFEYFEPPLVAGDAELGGDPLITIKARVYSQGNRVYRQIFMRADEFRVVGGIYKWWVSLTLAEGWSQPTEIYRAPAGWRIKPFRLTEHRLPRYIDYDDIFPEVFSNTPIGRLIVYGDHRGDDIGEYTQVFVDWDWTVNFVIEREPAVILWRR